jgi:plasmid stability protein
MKSAMAARFRRTRHYVIAGFEAKLLLCERACIDIRGCEHMATLVIRNVEPEPHARLKAEAAAHNRSMEEEARVLLRQAVHASPESAPQRFGQAVRAIFKPLGGFDMPHTEREPPRDPPDFSGPEWYSRK